MFFSRLIFLFILIFSFSCFAASKRFEKDLNKVSKLNSFIDDQAKLYLEGDIGSKKDTLLIIYNHGSTQDTKKDPCKPKPKFGYIWDAAVVPAILKLHNKKIKGLEIKIYRLCSGVTGMPGKDQKKYRKQVKSKGKIELVDEFKNLGFENIVLAGWSAGGWASLNLQSRFPDKIKGTIAFNPAFAGPKKEWQKKYPEWGAFREDQVNIFNQSDSLNALLFAHDKDVYEDTDTLSFFKKFKGLQFIDYSEVKPTTCTWADVNKKMESNKGHNIPQSTCFTKFINKNNYLINYLENIF